MKNKKILVPAILCVAVIIIITVVGLRNDSRSSYTGDLYFFNDTATSLVAESREIKYSDDQDLAEAVINELRKGPVDNKLVRIIEKKTQLLSLGDLETGNVVVNLSREFVTGDTTKDLHAIYSIVKSLCAIGNIDSVKIVIEGKDIATSDGSIIGYLTDQDINLPTDTYNSEMREVTLYFPKKDSLKLVKETRSIKVNDQQPIAQYIINELIKGPVNESLIPSLSDDSVLLSVETSDNICFVNFKANFLDKNSGNAEKEKLAVYSIVDSLTELESIDRVQLLMDGKRVDNFGSINIGSMFGRDESMIQ